MSIFKTHKGTKTVILIMTVLVLIGAGIAKLYYGKLNASEDPRVIDAKQMYKKYNSYAENNDFEAVFALLDSIKDIYTAYPDYVNSFETGVVYNNIGATWLSLFLQNPEDSLHRNNLDSASLYCNKSVQIYKSWLADFGSKNENELSLIVENYYDESAPEYKGKNLKNIKSKRVKDILEAQKETPRRLSVAYTNLGIISRHTERYDEAVNYYKKALELWKENLTAKNNLNLLLGREIEERNFIEKLFPEEK